MDLIRRETGTPVAVIGEILEAGRGSELELPDGRIVALEARGWDHLEGREAGGGDMKRAMTIAGSDSGGGAGIQADLKTFAAHGVFGTCAVTALTAQNTLGVQGVFEVPPTSSALQIDSIARDIGADAVKIGMLSNAAIIEVVAAKIAEQSLGPLVLDPVMVAKGGDRLLREDAKEALIRVLLPLRR